MPPALPAITTRALRLVAVTIALALITLAAVPATHAGGGTPTAVIVRSATGAVDAVAAAVTRLGGSVTSELDLIGGVAATVPSGAVDRLRGDAAVHSVVPDARVRMHHDVDGYDADTEVGSLHNTARMTKARDLHRKGLTGAGVEVALVDTGVTPAEGLLGDRDVTHGPDFSYESGSEALRHRDGYGHGTHMAGIITAGDPGPAIEDHDVTTGIAPGARVLNVKVGGSSGAADVSQVIAAIDWVVQHRATEGRNIRVLNLAFGTNGTQDPRTDPLSYAVEAAWRRGIVVVVAAGNAGKTTGQLSNPAYNPYVIAVGAGHTRGTMGIGDDTIPAWSSRGDGTRDPDVVAPGKSIASVRVPGSHVDVAYPASAVSATLTRGSGTSQAAAVVSAGAALLLEQRPGLTPDQVKHALRASARELPAADSRGQGAGLVDFSGAAHVDPGDAPVQRWPQGTGEGSLDAARGDDRVLIDGVPLEGEQTVWGGDWESAAWAADMWSGSSWSGSSWSGSSWSGANWTGTSWSGSSWSGEAWNGSSWSGSSWSGSSWSGSSWSGSSWSTGQWLGASWG